MSERIVDGCPSCTSDNLTLWAEPDGNETGTWTDYWYECESCGERLRASLVAGTYQPVVEEVEEPPPLDQQLRAAGAQMLPGLGDL